MNDSRTAATDRLQAEKDRLAVRNQQIKIVEDLFAGLTEEQMEALLAVSDLIQQASRVKNDAANRAAAVAAASAAAQAQIPTNRSNTVVPM